MKKRAGRRRRTALVTFLATACVVAIWLASTGSFTGLVLVDAALVTVIAAVLFTAGAWVVDRLRGPDPNPVELWARRRGLVYARKGELPEATPLLWRGESRRAIDVVTGELAPGMSGVLGRYTYTVGRDDGRKLYDYSVVVTRVPESVAFAPLLLCRHKRSARAWDDRPEDAYAARRPVEVESAELRRHYEIESWSGQDPIWTRELFSPTFIAWLADGAPERLSFEVTDGALCAALPGHEHEEETLDALVAATAHIAQRLRDESLEEEGRPDAAAPPGALAATAELEARVGRVRWPEPPPDAAAASRPYRRVAAREPRLWLQSLLCGAVVAAGVSLESLGEGTATLESLAASAAIGVVTLFLAAAGLARTRARRYGREAFVREYARSRGLALRDGRQFHAEHMRLPLPGTAEHAMSGSLRDSGLQVEIVLAADRTNRRMPVHYAVLVTAVPPVRGVPWLQVRHAATAAGSTRRVLPTAGDAGRRLGRLEEHLRRRYVVTAAAACDELAAERLFPPDVTSALVADGHAAYSLTLHGTSLAVFRHAPPPFARSAAELDRFCAEAGRIAMRLDHAVESAGADPGLTRG